MELQLCADMLGGYFRRQIVRQPQSVFGMVRQKRKVIGNALACTSVLTVGNIMAMLDTDSLMEPVRFRGSAKALIREA